VRDTGPGFVFKGGARGTEARKRAHRPEKGLTKGKCETRADRMANGVMEALRVLAS
jgi:hypothetical protein